MDKKRAIVLPLLLIGSIYVSVSHSPTLDWTQDPFKYVRRTSEAEVVPEAVVRDEDAKIQVVEGFNFLTPFEAWVIIEGFTEGPFSGKFNDHSEDGLYTCKLCDQPLFSSAAKFDSATGWPSFDDTLKGSLKEQPDGNRTEIECSYCGGHIGHVFREEKMTRKSTRHCVNSVSLKFVPEANLKRALFAGGCFWGVEHLLEAIPDVLSVTSGYVGGHVDRPTYEKVLRKDTGHAEAVEVLYDASKVSYELIARAFFEIHDPTQLNYQGPDFGEQYRSAVFYLNEEQRVTAQMLIDILKSNGLDVVTEVTKAGHLWKAEEYHQNYYRLNGAQPYCHRWTKRF